MSTTLESKAKSKESSPEPSSSTEPTEGTEPVASSEGTEAATSSEETEPPAAQTAWQAIFSPQFNAYYFYNSETQETTWVNPLQPPESAAGAATTSEASTSQTPGTQPDPSVPHYTALQNAALAQGIDPHLAYLDPSLAASTSSSSVDPSGLPSFQAKFNARTGQFAAMDSRSPAHLSEYERMKRMSEVFFDMAAWEQNLEQERAAEAEGGEKKRKRPSKKDLERFKQQKKLKKIAKTAWLRT
ncbi:hypothetical protein FB45DRAFT_794227 [Roridomyces roridus]|uniref:WW domain-containing protein n=1 Tax=Roridomyces roridus TaxID=1738132 RepID=A0AAD7FJU2_9AGAR|nr:hypothetical protein FB45DRAFT_794227 [Roridomyces roridus]